MIFGITISDYDDQGVLAIDLRHILTAIGEQATECRWLVDGVEAFGPDAERLHKISGNQTALTGEELIGIANEVDQIIDGKFTAFQAGSNIPWLIVSAVDSSAYDITTNDLEPLRKLLNQFPSARFIPGMGPSG